MRLIGYIIAAIGILGLLGDDVSGLPWAFGAIALGVATVALDRWLDSKDME